MFGDSCVNESKASILHSVPLCKAMRNKIFFHFDPA